MSDRNCICKVCFGPMVVVLAWDPDRGYVETRTCSPCDRVVEFLVIP